MKIDRRKQSRLPPGAAERDERVIKSYAAGTSMEAIAEANGIHRSSVGNILRRARARGDERATARGNVHNNFIKRLQPMQARPITEPQKSVMEGVEPRYQDPVSPHPVLRISRPTGEIIGANSVVWRPSYMESFEIAALLGTGFIYDRLTLCERAGIPAKQHFLLDEIIMAMKANADRLGIEFVPMGKNLFRIKRKEK